MLNSKISKPRFRKESRLQQPKGVSGHITSLDIYVPTDTKVRLRLFLTVNKRVKISKRSKKMSKMKHRKPLNYKVSKKLFSRTAKKVNPRNNRISVMRGGIRL